ncbi:hypothetical protein [Rhizobium sp. RAF56]
MNYLSTEEGKKRGIMGAVAAGLLSVPQAKEFTSQQRGQPQRLKM